MAVVLDNQSFEKKEKSGKKGEKASNQNKKGFCAIHSRRGESNHDGSKNSRGTKEADILDQASHCWPFGMSFCVITEH